MSGIDTESLEITLHAIVGEDNVVSQEDHLSSYARANIGVGESPGFIVKPQTPNQVEQLVRCARELRLNLVPASSGPPHMKGGTLLQNEGIVVDLSGMDDIVLLDRRNKVALIEPGITFIQLKEEAEKEGLKVLMPLLPKRNKSVLASYLERDPILVPKYHWDMTDPLLCTEVIFGNGQLYRTGSAGGPGSIQQKIEAKSMFKNPLGPGQTDLVKIVQGSQGTMGIVTWASVKLELKPKIHRLYFVADDKLESLIDFAYRVLRPKLADELFIVNNQAFATIVAHNSDDIQKLSENEKRFVLVYGVSGYEICPEERIAYQEHDIGVIAQSVDVKIFNEYMGVSGSNFAGIISEPSSEPYYKQKPKGGFIDIHFLTTLDKAQHFIQIMSDCSARHGYPASELGLYIQPILFGRACHTEFSIYYNPEDRTAVEEMNSFYLKASGELSKAGAFFSRPYGYWSDLAYARCQDTALALKKVKSIFDPDHILNQGKLVFTEEA
jgi:FAD/FMN-containing dehydrogenase